MQKVKPMKSRLERRLKSLRASIRKECVSYMELHELKCLMDEHLIPPDDLELLEWSSLPEEDLDKYTAQYNALESTLGSRGEKFYEESEQ